MNRRSRLGAPQRKRRWPKPSGAQVHQLDRGDNAWMLTSSALVLMMTAPGLAMFYGGLVRKKNVLSVHHAVHVSDGPDDRDLGPVGYSLSFGGSERLDRQRRLPVHEGVQATWIDGKLGDSAAHGSTTFPC